MDPNETQAGAPQPTVEAQPAPVDQPAPAASQKPEDIKRAQREGRKHEGVFDTAAAKQAKARGHEWIRSATDPVVDIARTHVTPKMHGVTDRMRSAGWKYIAVAVLLVCFALLIISLIVKPTGG